MGIVANVFSFHCRRQSLLLLFFFSLISSSNTFHRVKQLSQTLKVEVTHLKEIQ